MGKRGAPLVRLESILLVDPDPRQFLPPPRQLVAAPRQLLLRLEQPEPRCKPLFTCPGHVLRHRSSLLCVVTWAASARPFDRAEPTPRGFRQAGIRRSYSFRRRLKPSQNGSGSLPVVRATRTSRCICQPAPTPTRVARLGRRRWIPASSTSSPFGSSSTETPPLPSPSMSTLRAASASVILPC